MFDLNYRILLPESLAKLGFEARKENKRKRREKKRKEPTWATRAGYASVYQKPDHSSEVSNLRDGKWP